MEDWGRSAASATHGPSFTVLTPVRFEDFNSNNPTPKQVVNRYLDVDQTNHFAGSLPEENSPSLQYPLWGESSDDNDSIFPWLPPGPQAVPQVSDGSEDFQIPNSTEEVITPIWPASLIKTEQITNSETSPPPDQVEKRRFICSVCGKVYRMQSSLEKHLRVPCEVRPFKCKICDKAFKRADHLKAHSRMHTGERPFLCSLCGKTFRQKNHLQRHADRQHVNGKVEEEEGQGEEGEDVVDQDQNSSDVCGLEDLEDDEMRTEDQD